MLCSFDTSTEASAPAELSFLHCSLFTQNKSKKYYESTAGADASVEMPKLHNIKLLIAELYTHNGCCNAKLKEWVMIDHDCC